MRERLVAWQTRAPRFGNRGVGRRDGTVTRVACGVAATSRVSGNWARAMKVTLERTALLKALGHVHRIVEKRNTIPILSNVLIEPPTGSWR